MSGKSELNSTLLGMAVIAWVGKSEALLPRPFSLREEGWKCPSPSKERSEEDKIGRGEGRGMCSNQTGVTGINRLQFVQMVPVPVDPGMAGIDRCNIRLTFQQIQNLG